MQSTKEGFIWMNEGGLSTGGQPPSPHPWGGPGTFFMESILINMACDPVDPGGRLDVNCQVLWWNGKDGDEKVTKLIDIPIADRYQPSIGVMDIGRPRYFKTPWRFEVGEGIIAIPYALGAPGKRWGVMIHAEGYTERDVSGTEK